MRIVDAVKEFLEKNSPVMCHLYNENMELQVSVAQGDGVPEQGIYQGKSWSGFKKEENGEIVDRWKAFRIPFNANQDPTYDLSKELKFSTKHFNGIGLSGWDWKNKVSKWVVFDFDSLVGHSEKNPNRLTEEQLKEIEQQLINIDWITIRRSTSGNGLHIYVFVDNIPANNHTEHASLAKAILDKMSVKCNGFDFKNKVDVLGHIFWIWHEKMKSSKSFELVKQGRTLQVDEIPPNWKDHKDVVSGEFKKSKAYPVLGRRPDLDKMFDELTGKNKKVPLDEEHNKLIAFLEKQKGHYWYWSSDFHMLVTHTKVLEKAHKELGMQGLFITNSEGSNLGSPNCFCFPCPKGVWSVIRYGQGTREADIWIHTDGGFTRCYLNQATGFFKICEHYGGAQDPEAEGFSFSDCRKAQEILKALGEDFEVPKIFDGRPFQLTIMKKNGNKVAMVVTKERDDPNLDGWVSKPRPNRWVRLTKIQAPKRETITQEFLDDRVRHVVMNGESIGWRILTNEGVWIWSPKTDIKEFCKNAFPVVFSDYELSALVGGCTNNPWTAVNLPFQPEYVGGRMWNFEAPQLMFKPTNKPLGELHTPTWDKVFNHLGQSLTEPIGKVKWCRDNGILTGGDFLKCWVASMIRFPYRQTPFLFFYGDQDSGKSTFHEATSLLFSRGSMDGKIALSNTGDFNGELKKSVFVHVEEKDLSKDPQAYQRLKEWTTAIDISIHPKNCEVYSVKNTTHWCQFGNSHNYVPIAEDDTRIIIIYVPPLNRESLIGKHKLLDLLREEGPDFISQIQQMDFPILEDRFTLPVIVTKEKSALTYTMSNQLKIFLKSKTEYVAGSTISLGDFFVKFQEWMDSSDRGKWSTQRVTKELPLRYPQGMLKRGENDGNVYIGNISWLGSNSPKPTEELVTFGGYLLPKCQSGA